RAVPAAAWKRKRVSGWRRTHFADCNAAGTCGYTYDDRPGLTVCKYEVSRVGGQNAGSYEVSESGLRVEPDGSLWHVTAVVGSWSQWQGSSSGYTLTWSRYRGEYDLMAVVAAIHTLVETYRDRCRARRQAGAKEAGQLLAALAALAAM